jgi:hypothetical protein
MSRLSLGRILSLSLSAGPQDFTVSVRSRMDLSLKCVIFLVLNIKQLIDLINYLSSLLTDKFSFV